VACAEWPSCHKNSLVRRKGCGCLNSHLCSKAQTNGKTVVTRKIKHLQKCFSVLFYTEQPLKCLQMFYSKTFAKMLQNTFANVLACWTHVKDRRWLHLYNKRRYVCIYVPYGRPNGWADRDQTWHTHSWECPPRECFCQGQCQGHSCMRAGVTITKHPESDTRRMLLKLHPEDGGGDTWRNSIRMTDNYSSSNEARRRRRRAASAAGASRTPSGGGVTTASVK